MWQYDAPDAAAGRARGVGNVDNLRLTLGSGLTRAETIGNYLRLSGLGSPEPKTIGD